MYKLMKCNKKMMYSKRTIRRNSIDVDLLDCPWSTAPHFCKHVIISFIFLSSRKDNFLELATSTLISYSLFPERIVHLRQHRCSTPAYLLIQKPPWAPDRTWITMVIVALYPEKWLWNKPAQTFESLFWPRVSEYTLLPLRQRSKENCAMGIVWVKGPTQSLAGG
jgi:hypothetical protein